MASYMPAASARALVASTIAFSAGTVVFGDTSRNELQPAAVSSRTAGANLVSLEKDVMVS
jgi:hypothetical protein